MTIRDRAYNIIKRLKKVYFEDYCDVQREIEIEFQKDEDDLLAIVAINSKNVDRILELEHVLQKVQTAGQGGNCIYCGEEERCTEHCVIGNALKGK